MSPIMFDLPPPPPYARDFPSRTPRGPLSPEVTSAVESCVEGEAASDRDSLVACLHAKGLSVGAMSAQGPSDIVLLAIGGHLPVGESFHFIVWSADGGRRWQDLKPQLPWGNGYQLVAGAFYDGLDRSHVPAEARQSDDGNLLAVTIGIMRNGSGGRGSMMLLANEGDYWRVVWDGGRDGGGYDLGHSVPQFVGEGIGDIRMTASSWQLKDDPKRDIFHEANSGPHRWFDQTWALVGERYVLESEEVVPSGYNTLVEFMYALKTDQAAAASLTSDDDLTSTAASLGLVQEPDDQGWSGWCDGKERSYIDPPCMVELPTGDHVRVYMVPEGDSWLISAIEPTEFSPS